MDLSVVQEKRPSRVVAFFNSKREVNNAAHILLEDHLFEPGCVNVVPPNDTNFGNKLEPETQGIKKTLWKSHLIIGILGLAIGLVLSAVLSVAGPVATQSSPMMTFFSVTMVCLFLSLIIAGIIALRPDHDPVINNVREATNSGLWTLIVHTRNWRNNQKAIAILRRFSNSILQSL